MTDAARATDGSSTEGRGPDRGRMSRRGFLGASAVGIGLGMAGTDWGPWPGGAVGVAQADDAAPLRFAVLTDSHSNEEEFERLANLRRVFGAIEGWEPDFVLHCGDISDFGDDAGFAAHRAQIPDGLWDRVRHAPGNHEIRWDVTARERFNDWFGPTSYSFDVGGVHFMALDPTQSLQEPGLFAEDLEQIARDLEAAGDRPSVMFLHFPLAGRNYYVNDTEELLRTIAPHPVRAIFAGHIHVNEVTRFNGLTQVAAIATRTGPFYLRVTERRDRGERFLVVEQVTLGATDADEPTVEPITEIPLDATSAPGPIHSGIRVGGEQVELTAIAARSAVNVDAQLYPQELFGTNSDGRWTPLDRRGNSWHGVLDAAGLAPGVHRVQLRAQDAGGALWHETATLERRGRSRATPAWEVSVGGQLQGALAAHEDTLVAASTSGRVVAVTVGGRGRPKARWSAKLGAVHRGAAFSVDGSRVYVPSADHRLVALDAGSGRARWAADLGRPVMSTPLVVDAGGAERVLVVAGDRLVCLDAAGTLLWDAEVPRLSAGRAACDGQRVYVGAGDGNAYAYDLATGARLWSVLVTDRPDTYRKLIYGAWDDWVEILPTGAVLFSTVTNAIAVDASTGSELWRIDGSYIYAPSLVLADGGLLLTSEWGVATVVDAATGVVRWSAQVVPRVVNAGPVIDPDSGTAWLVSVGGLLASIDPATGASNPERQLFTANTFSTPVFAGGQLAVAAQDGVLRGFEV